MKPSTRRNFISTSSKAGLAAMIAAPAIGNFLQSCTAGKAVTGISPGFITSFDQAPLPYAYNALEPAVDALTMDIHYNKHAAAYSKNVKEAAIAEGVDLSKPLENVLSNISSYSTKMRNNGGGHYNHELFWKLLTPAAGMAPSEKLATAITNEFGSVDAFKKQFTDAAKSRFGSGWAWLVINKDKKLIVTSTPNQDNPLMNIAEVKGFPLLALDVWEHAYYLKYQNKRADYIDNFWKIVNWKMVSERFESI